MHNNCICGPHSGTHTQLDEVTNGSLSAMSVFRLELRSRDCHNGSGTYHNKEPHANGLADFDEFTLVGYYKVSVS